ncbi:microtubule binding protein furry isoform X3 [Rhodnius prolixus]|uniref:microtubule binding protein furry isoform X3 n=1 Tax=Rhodnius prolixus TaxID=13249 RepID=UPI003D189013
MMLQDIDSDEIDESGVESGNNSDSEAADTLNVGNSEASDSNSHQLSTSETVPTATLVFGAESDRGTSSTVTMLPWGAHKERSPLHVDVDIRPGEFVMRSLFTEFTIQAERKIEAVLAEPQEKQLSKVLQRGEDAQFDQLLCVFGSAAEHCLPSILKALFAWYDRQMGESSIVETKKTEQKGKSETAERTESDGVQEKRDLAVEFILCLVLIEVLKQLPFHPGHEDLVTHIENLSFRHFKYREGQGSGVNAANFHTVADLYAEVLGALAQSRFLSVKNRFLAELKELRAKEPCPYITQSTISLLMGMKFFRVKMVPIEEFEASFQFMQECAQYFLEVKDKDIKHALAGLFVEILVPVAASVKNEVNVPCLKNFVESLYTQTLDMCTKSKHRLALFPLVTCLLCVSQKIFFLQNLHTFLTMCLQHLKNRDPKMSRVALESLYRLLWVYMIRIKCESNSATQSRLQSIVNSLFPKGSKAVVPRDTPLNIFVKIIQFIAQERLDFAMREIVFDLLSVGRPVKVILTPERMSIGLRAFLVVADSLQQKEGEPPMPRTSGVLPSGNTLRVKKTFLNKMLTEDTARSIGMSAYFPHVRRVFVDILRALDTHYGRPLMMTSTQNVNKEPDEMITGERKPRIDLFRTCVAAVPRLIPDGITSVELVDLLARLTVHMDEELRALAYQSLQTLVIDFPDWRHDVVLGFTQFLSRDVPDTSPQLLDNGLRMLLQLLTSWKNAVCKDPLPQPPPQQTVVQLSPTVSTSKRVDHTPRIEPASNVLHHVEGFAIVMLCSVRLCPRRLSLHILREAKILLKLLGGFFVTEEPVIDVMESWIPPVLESCLHLLPATEKAAIQSATVDFQWLVDRSSSIWTAGIQDENSKVNTGSGSVCVMNGTTDPWACVLFGLLERGCVLTKCLAAVNHCWPIVYTRLHMLFTVIDPTPVSDNRASLLRSSAPPRRPVTERDMYLVVWRNYASLAMRVVPPAPSPVVRCASPDLSLSQQDSMFWHRFSQSLSDDDINESKSLYCYGSQHSKTRHKRSSSSPDSLTTERNDKGTNVTPAGLYKLLVPLLRCEVSDVRDAIAYSLAKVNSEALKDLMEELVVYIREAVDRKQENMRRRRRRDALRLHLVRVFELIAQYGTFGNSSCVLERDTQSLHPTIIEYIDGARLCLEMEPDKDALTDIKLHFCNFIRHMLKSFPLEMHQRLLKRDLRRCLFTLFAGWAGPLSKGLLESTCPSSSGQELQFVALQAMTSILCCGPCFDPNGLAEEGSLYPWIDHFLESDDSKIYKLACETVVLLLECNSDIGALLDWVVDRCYTAKPQVADGCFLALATIFSAREYPCDHYTAVINVTLMNTGCPRTEIQESALQLLQILDKRFFGAVVPLVADGEAGDNPLRRSTLDVILSSTYLRSQTHLSRQLAIIHPELTMPMFSEITYRFQTARPEVKQLLLGYLLPWLYNMELVDPNLPPTNPLSHYQEHSHKMATSMLLLNRLQPYYGNNNDVKRTANPRQEGWGSVEATEMVLNNLFYITAKFADQHAKEIEEVWATLCCVWPNNLKVIIRYLLIISGMAANELLQYAKRVVVFLARAKTDRLLDEMMTELHTVETLNWLIERTETPPFYRLTSMRKASSHSDPGQAETSRDTATERGTIHTKRHSGEDPAKMTCKSDTLVRYGFTPPRGPDKIRTSSGPPGLPEELMTPPVESEIVATVPEESKFDIPQPHPLPMPEYGGYFAPLTEYLPDSSQPSTGFHRCNVAVMLLTDVVVDVADVEWSIHLPLMLHILFLGLDHSRTLVHQHCKQLLMNLLIVLADHNDHLGLSQILLNRKTLQLGLGLMTPNVSVNSHNFTEPDPEFDSYLHVPVQSGNNAVAPNTPLPTTNEVPSSAPSTPPVIVVPEENNTWVPPNPGTNMPLQEVIKSLVDFLASRQNQVVWNYEDITAKVWSIRSVEQMDIFLQHVLRIFRESLPHAHISERWGQIALQLGLSCSSRHYAGRSLQLFRSLHLPLTSRMLSEILSRLVETVAEQGEDMQGYVTELLLTLEAAVDSLESDFRPLDFMKEIFKSTPNLNNKEGIGKRSPGVGLIIPGIVPLNNSHMRSTSYSVSYCGMRRTNVTPSNLDNKIPETESRCGSAAKYTTNLCRSRSAQSLKLLGDSASQDDKMTILAQLFWLSLSLLQSDYEHEFLLALRLVDRLLHRLPLDRPDVRDKVDKLQSQLKWNNFPGLHALLLKGCTNATTYEPVIGILSQCTPLLHLPVVDPTQNLAFPMTVIALLPYMLLHYEEANPLCIMSAENIAQVSNEKGKKLENLGTVMTLYSRRTFSKESFQWTKCVIKYLYDTYAHLSSNMLAFLVEVLEKGPTMVQLPVLSIIHCMLHYIDLSAASSQSLYADLLRVVSKYIEGVHWKEAQKVLKLVVRRSSTLVAPPMPTHHTHWEPSPHLSFTDSELFTKKELPGRTMDFTFDVTETPLIGKKIKSKEDGESNVSPRRSVSLSPADSLTVAGWKRPWVSQGRVRESLVNLLTACGQRVGLPKSPSHYHGLYGDPSTVIFSQSSEVLERQSSVASSTEEVSGPDLSAGSQNPDHFGVFKDFDFLEYESESVEGESTDNFNWGVRRRVLSEGDGELDPALRMLEESLSETTPVLSSRKLDGVEAGVEESSDDEVGSESPLDELAPGEFVPSSPGGGPPYTALSLTLRQRSNSTTHSDTSGSSGADLGELTPCNASPNLSAIAFRPITRHDSEEAWRTHIQSLVAHVPTSPLHLFHLLYRVVKDVIKRSISVSREACHSLSEISLGENLATHLANLTEFLSLECEPPIVWFSPDKVASSHLADTLRFGMLELQEHLETFLDKKRQASECIESLKVTLKLQENADMSVVLDMGRSLYKLHFQLVLLLESANKMYCALNTTAQENSLQNLSGDVVSIKKQLLRAEEEMGTTASSLGSSVSEANKSPGLSGEPDTLVRLLQEAKWVPALDLARATRGSLGSEVISTSVEDDDITNILNIYCCHLVKDIPDVFVVTDQGLGEIVSGLMQGLYQVLGAVNSLETKLRASDKSSK